MQEPFLSIITINYNDAAGLQCTMESVFEQTYSEFEYLCIDGGSNDYSVEIIKKYADILTYWISEKDNGIYHAMNKGIKMAEGKYLLFLNSGDTFTTTTALEDFINHPLFTGDIIYGDYKFETGQKIYPDYLYPAYFMKTSLPHQSTFFSKDVFDKMGGFDESYLIGGDREFFIRTYLSAQFKFVHIPYFLVFFSLKGISNNEKFRRKKQEEDERMFKTNYGVFYEDSKKILELEHMLKKQSEKTIKGIVFRIKNKISKLWKKGRW